MTLTKELVDWHQEQRCEQAVESLGRSAGAFMSWIESRDSLICMC